MTHTIDCKRATTPHCRARVRMSPPGRPKGEYRSAQHEGGPMDAPQPIGEACAVVGSRASRVFALRNGETGIGHKRMRCRAFPAGGVP